MKTKLLKWNADLAEINEHLTDIGFTDESTANYIGWIRKGEVFNTLISVESFNLKLPITFNILICGKECNAASNFNGEHPEIFKNLVNNLTKDKLFEYSNNFLNVGKYKK